jgi:hypothetical protein
VAPWLRPPRASCPLLGLLLFLPLVLAAGPAHPSYAAAYAPSYAGEPGPAESRAGSRAGEGRERPGRKAAPTDEDTAAAHPDGSAMTDRPDRPDRPEAGIAPEPSRNTAPRSLPPVSPVPSFEPEQAVTRPVRSSEPVLRVLPLGSGLVLIGLGLGLAFVALRVRRG